MKTIGFLLRLSICLSISWIILVSIYSNFHTSNEVNKNILLILMISSLFISIEHEHKKKSD